MPDETYGRRARRIGQARLGGMRTVLTVAGWLLLLQGAAGLADAAWGWWKWADGLLVVNALPVLRRYEVFASIVIGALGIALLATAGSLRRKKEEI